MATDGAGIGIGYGAVDGCKISGVSRRPVNYIDAMAMSDALRGVIWSLAWREFTKKIFLDMGKQL